jgi:NAD(P)-dependent dehydrogenase (short-subunit alcohol dehydrogenase family)
VSQDFAGKVAVITGGASGIGLGIATEMAARGARVVIADIEADALASAAVTIGATGIQTDVTDQDSVQALADETVARMGRVDVVCNNAGIGPMAMIADMTPSDWRWIIDVNLYGVIHGIHAFLPKLRANADGGFILNTASIAGLAAGMPGLGAYCVTKFGVVALTECLRAELVMANSAIGAGVLLPGPVRSNIGKSKRNRPATLGDGALADVELDDVAEEFGRAIPWLSPQEAGRIAADGIRDRHLYVPTHPQMFDAVGARHDAIAAAFSR